MGAVPVRVEVLSESAHTRVVRLLLAEGLRYIRKEPRGPGREERVNHEVAILRRLAGVDHIVHLAAQQPESTSILLDDVDASPVARVPTPLDGAQLVELMLALAHAVAQMHQQGVVHCDINPGNILLAKDGRSPYLIDFALAMTFAELRPDFTHHKEIVGTLPYLAPEQTGRTSRSVDRRADLYGLGATMYELATGRPPFDTSDPLRLIHDHLARAPVRPDIVNPAVPRALSDIIMHLLEKEPDNRYQTAEGLIRDLDRVRSGEQDVRVGQDDLPLRLNKPSRLIGREDEIDALRRVFDDVSAGASRGVVISGESGVGKTALVDELRPIVTAGNGWFSYGKFDRYRHDQEYDGVRQALRGLGRLLLAEPEDELALIRSRLSQALGVNVGMAAAVVPEFATVLKARPDPGDPLTAQVRARRTGVEILRAVASRERPVVFVIDDIQWAGVTPVGFLDQLLTGDEKVEGLLTVAVYRESQVHDAHPLAPLLARWWRQPGRPEHLRIGNLDQQGLAAMVAEMLRSPGQVADDLADAIYGLTGGNPYETVELLNGLRREGVLRPTGSGWWWDPTILERRLARENVTELMAARVASMPAATRELLEAMASLGGEIELRLLAVATGLSSETVDQRLAPALDDGLLMMGAGLHSSRFQHDRLRDVVLASIPASRLRTIRLGMARRLAEHGEAFAVAADQYLPVVDFLHDPQERRRVAQLLRQAADQSMWIGESLPAERMLAAAVRLTEDDPTLIELHTFRHAALFRLGRLEEADEVYDTILQLSNDPYDRVSAASVQISSLTNRNSPDYAIKMGLDLLSELGWAMPSPEQMSIEIDKGLDWCAQWMEATSEADDLRRWDVADPAILSAGTLISRMMPACFFRDQATMAWLALSAIRVWAEQGPTRTLIGAAAHLAYAFIGRRQDYHAAYRLMRRLLAVGEKRDFEPDLSQARFLYALGVCHWFNPLEDALVEGQRAREGLIRGGDLQAACYTFCTPVYALGVAPTIDAYASEVESALAFAEQTGNEHAANALRPYRWLVAALRGEHMSAGFTAMADANAVDPMAATNASVVRALAGILLDDPAALTEHSRKAIAARSVVEATYAVWQAHLVRAISLADQVRTTAAHREELEELNRTIDWMAQRAADVPINFRHLVSLVEAERAWAVRDFRGAIYAFDSALRDSDHRAWHRAYIAERSARFMLAHGLDRAGWALLLEARDAYQAWGARAKVDEIDRAYPGLDIPAEAPGGTGARRSKITAGAIDMLGVLAASRALSSETTIGALRDKVVEVVSAMTGATNVGLLLWHAEQRRWQSAADERSAGEAQRAGAEPEAAGPQPPRLPDSVVRYVERTREPLIISDAVRDDRFARDLYFSGLQRCSVLAAPVVSRGALQAILLLENHLIRNAFSAERLESVMLIAGQLAVSLDNALIYASLEHKVAERTRQLALANERLAQLSVTDPLTGLANRRRLEQAVRDERLRARRSHAPLSLAMVDIDHFKQYNDKYGHRAGDRCLQRVANQIARNVRESDLVARYGGEEFAIVMPDTDSQAGSEVAERVRAAVSRLAEPLAEGSLVTVSAGVATLYHSEWADTDQLLEWADAALYEAKRTGRDRVCSADIDGPDSADPTDGPGRTP